MQGYWDELVPALRDKDVALSELDSAIANRDFTSAQNAAAEVRNDWHKIEKVTADTLNKISAMRMVSMPMPMNSWTPRPWGPGYYVRPVAKAEPKADTKKQPIIVKAIPRPVKKTALQKQMAPQPVTPPEVIAEAIAQAEQETVSDSITEKAISVYQNRKPHPPDFPPPGF